MYLIYGVIRGVLGAVWVLPRVLEAFIGEVQLGGYRAGGGVHRTNVVFYRKGEGRHKGNS